jgi:hydrogenase expression/formation protein HypC
VTLEWTGRQGFGKLVNRPTENVKVCLGIPAKVIHIEPSGLGKVDYLGTKVRVNFSLLDEVALGDWVIVHAGFAISKLDEGEARETLDLLREIAKAQGE